MNTLNLDTNINNYSIKELEKMLSLENNYIYSDIYDKSKNLKIEIFGINIDNEKKGDIEIFLKNVVSRLERNHIHNSLVEIQNIIRKLNQTLN
jgi:hypothetical protein